MARLQARKKREIQRLERKAQRQGRAVKGSAGWRGRGRRGAWPEQVPGTGDHGLGCGLVIFGAFAAEPSR
jgi:hypothetical protein